MDNLKAEMQRNGLTVKDIMSTIGYSEKTARNKINGETDFTYPEAEKVRNVLFPGLRIQHLQALHPHHPEPCVQRDGRGGHRHHAGGSYL